MARDQDIEDLAVMFQRLLGRILTQRMFSEALLRRLMTDGGTPNPELLLEHLYSLQSLLPGVGPDAPAQQKEIGKGALDELGEMIAIVESVIADPDI